MTEAYGLDPEHVVDVLNQVLATETVCGLRYRSNYHVAEGILGRTVASEFLTHAEEEDAHAAQVAERITQLGGVPELDPAIVAERSHAKYVAAETLPEMIKENLFAERIAIESYSEIIRWLGDRDPTTRRLLESILEQEEEHANDMADLLRRHGADR